MIRNITLWQTQHGPRALSRPQKKLWASEVPGPLRQAPGDTEQFFHKILINNYIDMNLESETCAFGFKMTKNIDLCSKTHHGSKAITPLLFEIISDYSDIMKTV